MGCRDKPEKIIGSGEFDLEKLPLRGEIAKKIWQTKNWRLNEGGVAKRRDGSIASEEVCDQNKLSPVEKLDVVVGFKGRCAFTAHVLRQLPKNLKGWEARS